MTPTELAKGVLKNSRRHISKALTLIESERRDDFEAVTDLLRELKGHGYQSRKVAISGTPGVGKSSFIEAVGSYLVDKGEKVAVLAIDPSSPVSGGSILGDKTRMEKLSALENAFIRPSPSKGALGGVARSTRDACEIFEAAGYDWIFIETVGVGQSETLAHLLVDCFVMMHLPNSGDELQGIKKGITELADMVVIHKAEDENIALARAAKAEHARAAMYYHRELPVILASSLLGNGIEEFVTETLGFFGGQTGLKQELKKKRANQNKAWILEDLKFRFLYEIQNDEKLKSLLQQAENTVLTEQTSVSVATSDLFKKIYKH